MLVLNFYKKNLFANYYIGGRRLYVVRCVQCVLWGACTKIDDCDASEHLDTQMYRCINVVVLVGVHIAPLYLHLYTYTYTVGRMPHTARDL